MKKQLPIYFSVFALLAVTLACSITSVQNSASSAEKTSAAIRTDVSGIVSEGSGLLKTAQSVETEHPGILATAKAIGTQAAPLLSTIEGVATKNPGLVQTAQSFLQNELPTGTPPTDIPILNRSQAQGFIGYSQYIFYISPSQFQDVLQFYKTEMPINGWQYQSNESHEASDTAELIYTKDNRSATINLSVNPLNNTTVVVITLNAH